MLGEFAFGSQTTRDSIISETSLLSQQQAPLSVVLLEFHLLVLYKNCIKAVSILSQKVVWEESLNERLGPIQGLVYDHKEKTVWIYTPTWILEILVVKEDRDVWKMYLEKKQYELALQYCKGVS